MRTSPVLATFVGHFRRSCRPQRMKLTIRTFLIVITAIGIWLGVLTDKAQRQRRAVTRIREMGGWVAYDWQTTPHLTSHPPGPTWLRAMVGDDFFQEVTVVTFWDTAATDLSPLADLPHLKELSIPGPYVTDISPLAGLKQLE
jgi:hypothetical protein